MISFRALLGFLAHFGQKKKKNILPIPQDISQLKVYQRERAEGFK